jgi:hypothetical protein
MTNIPIGYNEDGEYIGYGHSTQGEKEQHFVKVYFTPEETNILSKALVELSIQASFPPANKDELSTIISAEEKLRLAQRDYEQENGEDC